MFDGVLSRKERVSDTEPIIPFPGRSLAPGRNGHQPDGTAADSFDRKELNLILGVYGTKVAEGEWRDYALDFGRDQAVFSIFRRTSEMPLYRIVKASEAGAQAGDLRGDRAGRPDPEARPRSRASPARARAPAATVSNADSELIYVATELTFRSRYL